MINNIGRPFDNTSAFVLDPYSETILPRGSVGELCFGGLQVFRGYLNRPELNVAKLIHHPKFGRIYRSGDMGIMLPDDSILFTGRADDQVKIRGQRVELGEITSVILDQSFVHDCATLLLKCENKADKLVSLWVPKTSIDTNSGHLTAQTMLSEITTLFAQLSSHLPAYMVPAHLVPIKAIPMTAQGKIDKRSIQGLFEELTDSELDHSSNINNTAESEEITDAWELQVAQALAECVGELSPAAIKRGSSFYSTLR